VETDPHKALELVDQTFKSRPDFDTWFGAYRTRLEALVGLNEREEALRTYERFRAKLYQRGTFDRIESLLLDPTGPLAALLDDQGYNRELVDLYEVMPDREQQFVEHCVACAQACLEQGDAAHVGCALGMLREAEAVDAAAVNVLLPQALAAATSAGLDVDEPSPEACKKALDALEEDVPPHVLVVGGDEGRRPHLERFQSLAERVGFEGSWIFTGSRPPQKALEEIEEAAEDTSAIVLHHRTEPEIRDEVRKLAEELEIPLREAPWLGLRGLQDEVLRTIRDYAAEE
jgi:hypothetical protein